MDKSHAPNPRYPALTLANAERFAACPTTHSLARAAILARAFAETMRARVDPIHAAILAEAPIYVAPEWRERARNAGRLPETSETPPERITDWEKLWLASDADAADCYAEADRRLRAEGIKPDDMEANYCPALVADHLQIDAETALIKHLSETFGFPMPTLPDHRARALDLALTLATNHPKFTPPKLTL